MMILNYAKIMRMERVQIFQNYVQLFDTTCFGAKVLLNLCTKSFFISVKKDDDVRVVKEEIVDTESGG
jgi:hypothetical protein